MTLSIRPAAVLLVLGLLGGCSSSGPGIRLVSQGTGDAHSQSFRPGVASVRDAGETDIVVNCQDASHTPGVPSVTQVLHMRVLWQQGFTIKAGDRDASQNASLHLYVYPTEQTPGTPPQVTEYSGTGLVMLDTSGSQVQAKIIQAHLTPVTVTKQMADPLGTCALTGKITARIDHAATAAMIGDLAATAAAAKVTPAGITEARLPKE